jgi:hypothetical protein
MIGKLTKELITMITSKKTRISVAIAAAAAASVITLAGCGTAAASHPAPPAGTKPSSAPPASQAPAPATTPTAPTGLAPGTHVTTDGGGTLTIDSVQVTAGTVDGQKPDSPPDPRFVIAHFTGTAPAGLQVIPEDLSFRDAYGAAYAPDANLTTSAMSPADMNGNSTFSGYLVFDVPIGHGVIAYAPGIGDNPPVLAAWAC